MVFRIKRSSPWLTWGCLDIQVFHVTSYQANFASHTSDCYVGFLFAWPRPVLKKKQIFCTCLSSSYHNTKVLSFKNISTHTHWNFKSCYEVRDNFKTQPPVDRRFRLVLDSCYCSKQWQPDGTTNRKAVEFWSRPRSKLPVYLIFSFILHHRKRKPVSRAQLYVTSYRGLPCMHIAHPLFSTSIGPARSRHYEIMTLKIKSNTENPGNKEMSNTKNFSVWFKIFQCDFSVLEQLEGKYFSVIYQCGFLCKYCSKWFPGFFSVQKPSVWFSVL